MSSAEAYKLTLVCPAGQDEVNLGAQAVHGWGSGVFMQCKIRIW